MKTIKFLFIAILLSTGSTLFADSFIRLTSHSSQEETYVYNTDNLNSTKYTFSGEVSANCVSVRVIWVPKDSKELNKYLINPKTYKGKVDDFVLKQYVKGSGNFAYNVSGKFDNLQFGSNYYRFIANFEDGTVDYTDLSFYVYQGGMAEKAKPVIYLYPTKTQKIKVTVKPEGGVTESIPEYKKGWTVQATPEGVITDTKTKQEYPYLFWESKDNGKEIDLSKGFVVETKNLQKFFDEKLKILGLNEKEIADFTEYWIPELQGSKYIFITFYSQERIDEEAPLTVSPKPDSVIRVYFDHKKLDKKITVEEQILTPAQRTGFAVVEWGGKRYK